MNTIRAIQIAVFTSAALFAAGALAQQAPAPQPATTAPAKATTAKPDQHAVPAPGSRNCIRDTGSHIPPPKGQCLPVAGRSYSQQDIQRTGAVDVGQALQMLDPSVRVSGGH